MIKPTNDRWTGQGLKAHPPKHSNGGPGAIQYSEELALDILDWVSSGKSLNRYCNDADGNRIPGRPTRQAVLQWRANIKGFGDMFSEAMRDRAHCLVDEIIEIADTEDDPKRARNRIDARKWAASKYLPRVYGDRVAVTGAENGDPIKFEGKAASLTDAELLAIASKGLTTKI